jgi:hypothetical protein
VAEFLSPRWAIGFRSHQARINGWLELIDSPENDFGGLAAIRPALRQFSVVSGPESAGMALCALALPMNIKHAKFKQS